MRDERNRLAAAISARLLFKPRPLRGLGLQAGTQKLCVDRQDNLAANRYRPVVGTDDVQPLLMPGAVYGAARRGTRPNDARAWDVLSGGDDHGVAGWG
jgi:hypothetical protein